MLIKVDPEQELEQEKLHLSSENPEMDQEDDEYLSWKNTQLIMPAQGSPARVR